MARARLMMIISALTTLIAIAAVVSVIGYRVFNNGGPVGFDGIITLPKGARVISTVGFGRPRRGADRHRRRERIADLRYQDPEANRPAAVRHRAVSGRAGPPTRLHGRAIAFISRARSLRLAV